MLGNGACKEVMYCHSPVLHNQEEVLVLIILIKSAKVARYPPIILRKHRWCIGVVARPCEEHFNPLGGRNTPAASPSLRAQVLTIGDPFDRTAMPQDQGDLKEIEGEE